MKILTKIALTVATAISLAVGAQAQTTTFNWNFNDLDGIYDGGTPVNFSISALTAVNSTLLFNTTSPSNYTGASGGGNASVSAKSGALNLAKSTYFTFSLTPSASYAINSIAFSLGSRSTGSGPILLTLFSSTDGFATPLATTASPNDSSWNLCSFTFSNTGATNAPFEFRLYGSGGNSTSSN
ncbi:MAG: hypothetical protein ABI233_05770 [Chthoniobacterales bacterium]